MNFEPSPLSLYPVSTILNSPFTEHKYLPLTELMGPPLAEHNGYYLESIGVQLGKE